MLGKDHILLSIATMMIFLVPAFFINFIDLIYLITLLVAVSIGALIPDADCGGKATLYYRYPMIDKFMKIIIKPIVWGFGVLVSRKKIRTEHHVKEEHRGIIHSPIGVLISTIFLIIPITIFMLFIKEFSFWILLMIFLGLLIGQFLHLLQDSCTVAGINWAFPFGTNEIKGGIYTFDRQDQRTKLYSGLLFGISVLLVIGYSFNKINLNPYLLYSLLILISIVVWVLILFLSKHRRRR